MEQYRPGGMAMGSKRGFWGISRESTEQQNSIPMPSNINVIINSITNGVLASGLSVV